MMLPVQNGRRLNLGSLTGTPQPTAPGATPPATPPAGASLQLGNLLNPQPQPISPIAGPYQPVMQPANPLPFANPGLRPRPINFGFGGNR